MSCEQCTILKLRAERCPTLGGISMMRGQNIMVKISREVRYWNSTDKELRLLQFSMNKDRRLLKPLFPPFGKDVKLWQSPISNDSKALRYCRLLGRESSLSHQRISSDFKQSRVSNSFGNEESRGQDFITQVVRQGFLKGKSPGKRGKSLTPSVTSVSRDLRFQKN
ncbi:LOW QUALITY PROTEIN: hypothetical protein PanWU01x14_038230 [Parasponia andersonii]|uniref:Uncharacterized protein n=1 Tax=Parasponia andersonii TaxID=3476 RepID=A0A2P5DRG5_PARAD|nr:LOW QUALITY PROTEIN: hypothetical protein PanWU01x14_038230 [Parasponia andersonii]